MELNRRSFLKGMSLLLASPYLAPAIKLLDEATAAAKLPPTGPRPSFAVLEVWDDKLRSWSRVGRMAEVTRRIEELSLPNFDEPTMVDVLNQNTPLVSFIGEINSTDFIDDAFFNDRDHKFRIGLGDQTMFFDARVSSFERYYDENQIGVDGEIAVEMKSVAIVIDDPQARPVAVPKEAA